MGEADRLATREHKRGGIRVNMPDQELLIEVLEVRAREGRETKLSPKVTTILTDYVRELQKMARLYPTTEKIHADILGICRPNA